MMSIISIALAFMRTPLGRYITLAIIAALVLWMIYEWIYGRGEAAALAAAARCNILACTPGVLGNAITIAAAAGSGTAAVLNTETRLNRGTGLNVVPVVDAS